MQAKRRVVITGIGAVTPLGHSFESTWRGVLKGQVGVGAITRFDASLMPTRIAAEVRSFELNVPGVTADERAGMNSISEFAFQAAWEALNQAGLWNDKSIPSLEKSVCLGIRPASPDFQWYVDRYIPAKFDQADMRNYARYNPMETCRLLAAKFSARGGSVAVQTACASSGQSIGEAYESIARGHRTVVLSGGVDSMIEPFSVAGFCLLGALSTDNDAPLTASRPFDAHRSGFVLGEGACLLVLEEREHALQRGANILGEICGYGVSESAYRITDLSPDGTGPIEAMQMALAEAGIAPTAVHYINAHGTSTLLNDAVEALAIRKVFGETPLVSSTKSMTGHLIAAAGAIEFAFCIRSLADQMLPPSVNCFEQDPKCPISLTASTASPASLQYALSNSVGFGGSNTSLIARGANQ